ncbi:hypothetical protein VTO73DRAFT_9071 [Trametes versicolor]
MGASGRRAGSRQNAQAQHAHVTSKRSRVRVAFARFGQTWPNLGDFQAPRRLPCRSTSALAYKLEIGTYVLHSFPRTLLCLTHAPVALMCALSRPVASAGPFSFPFPYSFPLPYSLVDSQASVRQCYSLKVPAWPSFKRALSPVAPAQPAVVHQSDAELTAEEEAEIRNDPGANCPTQNMLLGTTPGEKHHLFVAALQLSQATSRWKFGERGSSLDFLHSVARLTMRIHGPELTVSQAVSLGLIMCAAPTPEDGIALSVALQECEPATRDRYYKVAKWLVDMVPFLSDILPLLSSDAQALSLLGTFVDYHARQGRASDIGSIKENISKWIPTVEVPQTDGPPIVISPNTEDGIFDKDRANWGWNSAWSARLLIWMSCRDTFDADIDNFLEGLKNGNINMDHKGFPAFCYALTGKQISSDPKDFLDGLFEGLLLLSAYRCVWTSPESSVRPLGWGGCRRATISRASGINTVDGGKIAYIVCLVRHILSSESTWYHQNPAVFDGGLFYNRIVKLFEYKAFATPLLKLYQKWVYGTHYAAQDAADDDSNEFDQAMAYLENATVLSQADAYEYDAAVAAADTADAYNAAAAAELRRRNAAAAT